MKLRHRYKFSDLTNGQKIDITARAIHAGFTANEVRGLYFKVINGKVLAFSETNLKDQPI